MATRTFHIQLDGVTLTTAQAKALATELDKVVSAQLAKLDYRGSVVAGRPYLLNPEWLGLWLRDRKLGTLVDVGPIRNLPNTLPDIPQQF